MNKKLLTGILLLIIVILNYAFVEYLNLDIEIPNYKTNDVADYFLAEEESNVSVVPATYFVVRVIDGDTIDVEMNDEIKRVRYIGIDTPENTSASKPVECFAQEATERNRELVEGKYVTLVKDISETDKYGRLLRYVYVEDNFVNLALVEGGYANVLTIPPDVKNSYIFLKAEQIARVNGKGLWGDVCK